MQPLYHVLFSHGTFDSVSLAVSAEIMTDYTFIAHTRGPLNYTDYAKYFLEQHATSFGNNFSVMWKKIQDSLYRFAAKRNRILKTVNPSKVLGTCMPNDLSKNYCSGMMWSFAKRFLKHFTME